jgi:tetratricopeptide (TPR) repeat protein
LHLSRRTKASLYDARRLLEQSLAIDPGYARAAAMLSWTHFGAYVEPFDGDYLNPAALDRAVELAGMAVHLDPRLPQARAQLGYVLLYKRRHDAAIAEFERAFALNPNYMEAIVILDATSCSLSTARAGLNRMVLTSCSINHAPSSRTSLDPARIGELHVELGDPRLERRRVAQLVISIRDCGNGIMHFTLNPLRPSALARTDRA